MLVRFTLLLAIPTGLAPWAMAAPDPVSEASAADIENLLQAMSRHATDPAALSQEELNRTALRGLLQEGRTGAVLLEKSQAVTPPSPPLMACPAPEAAYVRMGSLTADSIQALAAFLGSLPPAVTTLILDLRAPAPEDTLGGAVRLASLFLPEKTPLFLLATGTAPPQLQSTATPPVWTHRVWLLADDAMAPAAELAGHLLVRHAGALVFGSPGSGHLTEYVERPLGPGHIIRLPAATVSWPDGTRLTGTPLVPATLVKPLPESRGALLSLTDRAGLPALLREMDRPRFNEAALMAGTHPELLTEEKPAAAPRPDPVLQQAMDLLETSAFLKLDAPEEIKRAAPPK